jgi:hypothetical protein
MLLNFCVLAYLIRRYYSAKIQTPNNNIAKDAHSRDAGIYKGKLSIAFRTFLHRVWVVALALFFWSPAYVAWSTLPFPKWLR